MIQVVNNEKRKGLLPLFLCKIFCRRIKIQLVDATRLVEGSVVALRDFSAGSLQPRILRLSACDGFEVFGGPARQVGAFGEVLSQQAVGVLVRRLLPRRVRVSDRSPMCVWPESSFPRSQVTVLRSCSGKLVIDD